MLWSGRVLVTLAAALAFAGCDVSVSNGAFSVGLASGRATDEWKREYAIASGGRLAVKNINGAIVLESASAGGKTRVRAERIAHATSDDAAKELLGNITIEEDVTPGAVSIHTRAPSGWRSGGHEVRYFVTVPPDVTVEAHTTNGGVRMAGLRNDVDVSAVNGGINGERLSGRSRRAPRTAACTSAWTACRPLVCGCRQSTAASRSSCRATHAPRFLLGSPTAASTPTSWTSRCASRPAVGWKPRSMVAAHRSSWRLPTEASGFRAGDRRP
jgi:hypothetical protein